MPPAPPYGPAVLFPDGRRSIPPRLAVVLRFFLPGATSKLRPSGDRSHPVLRHELASEADAAGGDGGRRASISDGRERREKSADRMTIQQAVMLGLQASVVLIVFGFGLQTTLHDLQYLVRRPRLLARSLLS